LVKKTKVENKNIKIVQKQIKKKVYIIGILLIILYLLHHIPMDVKMLSCKIVNSHSCSYVLKISPILWVEILIVVILIVILLVIASIHYSVWKILEKNFEE
jgi:hypothetical protein